MQMNKGKEVMEHLRPNGGWVIYGEDFESIQYFDACEPISKELFDSTMAKIEQILQDKKQEKENQKQSIFDRLGITQEEAKLILS